MTTDKANKRQNQKKRLYRKAKRLGLRMEACPEPKPGQRITLYRLLDRASKEVIFTAAPGGQGLTLDQVEEYLNRQARKVKEAQAERVVPAQPDEASRIAHAEDQEDLFAPPTLRNPLTTERRLAQVAYGTGLRLERCPAKDSSNPDFNTFRLVDRGHTEVVYSARREGYGLSLDQVEEYLVAENMGWNKASTEPSAQGLKSTTSGSRQSAKSQRLITIAGTAIPNYVKTVYDLLARWDQAHRERNQAAMPSPLLQKTLAPYINDWMHAHRYSIDQMRLFMFAHLHGAKMPDE